MRSTEVAALLALIGAGAALGQPESQEHVPAETYTRPAERFAVDGQRRLNLFCIGDGTPAIVFISGAWDNTMAWRRVQGPASHLSRACSYDRAGLGFSDPATRPSTALNAVDDLKNLLDTAKVETPVVLVGHSAGGVYAMIFTALYPDRVAGLVLVDPSDPEANNNFALSGHHPANFVEGTLREIETNHERLRHCVDLARDGALTPANTDPYCLMTEADPVLKAELDRQHVRLQTKEVILSEMISQNALVEGAYSLNELQYREAIGDGSFGQLPLILLRRGTRLKHPALPQEIFDKNEAILLADHERMAAYSTIGAVRAIPNSGHHIQLDQPAAVIAAIEEVVAAVSKRAPYESLGR